MGQSRRSPMLLTLAAAALARLANPASAELQGEPKARSGTTENQTEKTKPFQLKPGHDRWKVKTASDPDARAVDPRPVRSTVEKLLELPRPVDLPLDGENAAMQERRARPAETTVFTVEADLIECRLMPDGDYRVVLRGASGKTMVMEMPRPDPKFINPFSPFSMKIKSARSQFDKKAVPNQTTKKMHSHARITGIGFFGRAYGPRAKEAKGNLIQLHPVLNIEWLSEPTEEFRKAGEESRKSPEHKTGPGSRSAPPMP